MVGGDVQFGLAGFIGRLVSGRRGLHLELLGRGHHLVGRVGVGQRGVVAGLGGQKALSGRQATAAAPHVCTLGQRDGLGCMMDQ